MTLSIIVPVYNEEENVLIMYEEIEKALGKFRHEVIFVNDGSSDKTEKRLTKLYKEEKNVRVINFLHNYGKDAAMLAGIEYASGKYIAIIDGDMQQDPKYLAKMYNFLVEHNDYDQVCMIPRKREDVSLFKRIGSKLFYKIINMVSTTKFMEDASDFRMFNRKVKDYILSKKKDNLFLKGLFNDERFNIKYVYYDVLKRKYGESKYPWYKAIPYAAKGIINYTDKPCYNALFLGFTLILLALLMILNKKSIWLLLILLFIGLISFLWGIISMCLAHKKLAQIIRNSKTNYVIKNIYGKEKK